MSTVDDSVRELLLLMPRMVGRAKKLRIPDELRSFSLAPRHITALQQEWSFHMWDDQGSAVRWMTAFETTESDADAFISAIRAAVSA